MVLFTGKKKIAKKIIKVIKKKSEPEYMETICDDADSYSIQYDEPDDIYTMEESDDATYEDQEPEYEEKIVETPKVLCSNEVNPTYRDLSRRVSDFYRILKTLVSCSETTKNKTKQPVRRIVGKLFLD